MSSTTREIMHDQHSHPVHGMGIYLWIGLILILVTGGEVACYYFETQLGALVTPLILVLSAIKFALVVMFYMHLKYDSKVFTGVFLFPFALGSLVIVGMTILYHVLHPLH